MRAPESSLLRLRQICLVAADLDSAEDDLKAILGLEVAFRDPGLADFGLRNVMLPIGDNFLEVVSPFRENTTAGRFLERRGGEGGYMVILQCGDVAAVRARAERLDIRIVWEDSDEQTTGIQLHPKDLPGALVDLRSNTGDQGPGGPWIPAGTDWQRARRTEVVRSLVAAEIQCDDPDALAARWSELTERPVSRDARHNPEIRLDGGSIRFVTATDGRGIGLGGIDVEVVDRDRLLAAAEARSCEVADETMMICGTRIRLV
jgi:catechol 2,3-dioxygenase-like lactoylglutathione lyase family enzyme